MQMSERDELAELYADILSRRHGIITSQSKDAADELIHAGYRKPCTVTTADEMNSLPVGSIVMDVDGEPWRKMRPNLWASRDSCEESATVFWTHSEIHPTVLHEGKP